MSTPAFFTKHFVFAVNSATLPRPIKGHPVSEEITVKEYVAERLMEAYGWDLDKKDEHPLEWDPEREDSQYAMTLDTAEHAIKYTLEALELLDKAHHEDQFPPLDTKEDGNVKSSATTYIFLDNEAKAVTVGDVRGWLAEVDGLEIPDYFLVEGYLHLMFDEKLQLISRNHPSLINKSDSEIRKLEINAARQKIDYLLKEGNIAEAERFLSYLREAGHAE
jgi:hypothetical protein